MDIEENGSDHLRHLDILVDDRKSITSHSHQIWINRWVHCQPGKFEPAYIECGNSAEAKQVSQSELVQIGPNQLVQLVGFTVHGLL